MKFYKVTSEKTYALAYYINDMANKKFCQECELVYEKERFADYKVKFIGKRIADFYQAPGCYIGNKKFIGMLENYGITGYGIRGIDCVSWTDKRGNPIKGNVDELSEITIEGKCGALHHLDGSIVEGCPKCGMVDLHGQVNGLQVTDWDGSDIFSFSNWIGVMICSDKLKEACEKEKIKGISFIPIEKLHLW